MVRHKDLCCLYVLEIQIKLSHLSKGKKNRCEEKLAQAQSLPMVFLYPAVTHPEGLGLPTRGLAVQGLGSTLRAPVPFLSFKAITGSYPLSPGKSH